MSIDMYALLPDYQEDFSEKWMTKFKELGMVCEIHPDFSFATPQDSGGFLPFKLKIFNSKHPELNDKDFYTGFEFYFDEVNHDELDYPENLVEIVKKCQYQVQFNFGISDLFEFRMAVLSAYVLAEIGGGVVYDPNDGTWHYQADILPVLKEIEDAENKERFKRIKVFPFKSWDGQFDT